MPLIDEPITPEDTTSESVVIYTTGYHISGIPFYLSHRNPLGAATDLVQAKLYWSEAQAAADVAAMEKVPFNADVVLFRIEARVAPLRVLRRVERI